jgi:hypothetical protein
LFPAVHIPALVRTQNESWGLSQLRYSPLSGLLGYLADCLIGQFIKSITMKDFFSKKCRGHQFEFTRVISASFDPWYYISVNHKDAVVKFRMHSNKEGNWKITIARLPWFLYSLETEFAELIQLNEKPGDSARFHGGFATE